MKELKFIMLVDDNFHDNFFHERAISQNNKAHVVIIKTSGAEGLGYIESNEDPHPDLIFLDINMPGMNGWEFLEKYKDLTKELQSQVIIIMLTTSENPQDIAKAKATGVVADYLSKPLTTEMMEAITAKFFKLPPVIA